MSAAHPPVVTECIAGRRGETHTTTESLLATWVWYLHGITIRGRAAACPRRVVLVLCHAHCGFPFAPPQPAIRGAPEPMAQPAGRAGAPGTRRGIHRPAAAGRRQRAPSAAHRCPASIATPARCQLISARPHPGHRRGEGLVRFRQKLAQGAVLRQRRSASAASSEQLLRRG